MPKAAPRSLAQAIKKSGYEFPKKRTGSLWQGPSDGGPLGGITYSALCKFLNCRERFRVSMVEGIRGVERFSSRMEYGNMWHVCEEHFAAKNDWQGALKKYGTTLGRRYPMQRGEIAKWLRVCSVQFPQYESYWKKHPDEKQRTGLYQEQVFNVPYELPSGRIVRLRGKFDGIDWLGSKRNGGVYLFETKSKSDIDDVALGRQLRFDLQTMLYLTAMGAWFDYNGEHVGKIRGFRYNVVRRPLSGGKHSITRHKAKNPKKGKRVAEETEDAFYKRLEGLIRDNPSDFFIRWRVEVTESEIMTFRRTCLDPILEQLCDWWEHIVYHSSVPKPQVSPDASGSLGVYHQGIHWRHPFGVFNAIDEEFGTDVDDYLETGSMSGLRQVDTLFTELQ